MLQVDRIAPHHRATACRGVADERKAFHLLFATEDRKEGMSVLLEKRTARWKGA
jgi:hypothetical protein